MLPVNLNKMILIYLIAALLSPILAYIGGFLEGSLLFYILEAPVFAIPLGYYFTVDECGPRETAIIAFIFGFTLTPFLLIPAAIFGFQLSDFIGFIDAGQYTMLLKMLMNTVFTIVASLFMWKVTGIIRAYLKKKSKN